MDDQPFDKPIDGRTVLIAVWALVIGLGALIIVAILQTGG